jgi:DNA repair protein RecN (Recombination protein N)
MLTHVHIQNFTIIDELDLELHAGMTTLTGETGAGKSIIIDAVQLALGGRADNKAIRHGCDRADITLTFDLQKIPAAQRWLSENDFSSDNDCILRRTISTDGRSRNTINGQAAPLQLMRELGNFLINIHGQHEHQSLLKRDEQRQLLDHYAGHSALLTDVEKYYAAWFDAQKKLDDLQTLAHSGGARSELVSYQVQELDKLALEENELATLEQEHKQLSNADSLLEKCQQAWQLASGDEDSSAITLLNAAQTALAAVSNIDPKIQAANALIETAIIQTQEASEELRDYLDRLELNPERLRFVEQRLQTIYDMARKHRIPPEELTALHARLKNELSEVANVDERLAALQTLIAEQANAYKISAQKLTQSRIKASKKLSPLVTASMHRLGMPGGRFDIQFESLAEQFSAQGLERLEFMVSANPGQPLQALSKVASGGELSRISLAIQVITAQTEVTPTLVFDEVDVGIGGSTAAIVGELLRTLGNTTQVLCVTHLPQVAARGHHHLQINKHSTKNTTTTEIRALNPEEKVHEIARMLGGLTITDQTLAHAKEMLETP